MVAPLAAPEAPTFWIEAPIEGDPSPILAHVPPSGAVLEAGAARLLRPVIAPSPRRVGIQPGHWKTAEAPDEFPTLVFQLGGSFDGTDEIDVNLDIADRVAALLRQRGVVVDILPTTIPPGYLADAFVSLHCDGDEYEEAHGFKIAHGFYRGPHEDALVEALRESYDSATGLPWEPSVSSDMTDYYAFAWYRWEHSLSPFTPAAIVELGFLTSPEDRVLLLDEPDLVARGVAEGVLRFLDTTPRSRIFAQDIRVPTVPPP